MARPNWTVIAQYDVPEGRVFQFDRFGVGYSCNGEGYLHFGVCIDDKPLGPGLGDFEYEMGALNFADMCIVQQRIKGQAKVTIEARIDPAAPDDTYTAYGRIFGYLGADR